MNGQQRDSFFNMLGKQRRKTVYLLLIGKVKEKAAYGEEILQKLSKELTSEFGNGFSYANLRNMRHFYRTYPDPEKCYTVCSKLSWSQNRLIMRVADADAREWCW